MGMPSKTALMQHLLHLISRDLAKGEDHPMGVVGIGLRGFSDFNAAFGHHVGDELLSALLQKIHANSSPDDLVCRGTGSLLLVLTQNPAAIARKVMFDLHDGLNVGVRNFCVVPRIGYALYPDDTTLSEGLVRMAETAARRSTWHPVRYDAVIDGKNEQRIRLHQDLQATCKAPRKGGIHAAFMPIHNRNGHPVKTEALARWKHPKRGVVPTAEFIPLAESTGLIADIDRVIMEQSIEMMASLPSDMGIHLNLSGDNAGNPVIPSLLQRLCSHAGVAHERISLEITESAIIKDHSLALETVMALRDDGFGVVLDDFGTGYGTMTYLKDFPVTGIKLDKSLVDDVHKCPRSRSVAEIIIELARRLDLHITAEGIECTEQQQVLCDIGVDNFQGYLYAPAMGYQALMDYLRETREGKRVAIHPAEA
jgi:diguanylate cyclase (GGDEF)-like protein